MNLLDELAKNSYKSSSFFSQFDNEQLQDRPARPPDHNFTFEQPNYQQSGPEKKITNLQKILNEGNNHLFQGKSNQQKEYMQLYHSKLTKISAMVNLLSAKTRKIKYQFMVHLQRWIKNNPKNSEKAATLTSAAPQIPIRNFKKQQNLSLYFAHFSQICNIVENKAKQYKRIGFSALNKQLKSILKIECSEKILQTVLAKKQKELKQQAFLALKNAKKENSIKYNLKKAKKINLCLLKSVQCRCKLVNPLPNQSNFEQLRPQTKQFSLHPQNKDVQNIDFCDTLPLFMQTQIKKLLHLEEPADLSFSNTACRSLFEVQKQSLSQKSYIKQFSDIQHTAIPISGFAKRKTSEFTISAVEDRIIENYSHVEPKNILDACLNPIRSEKKLHNESKMHKESKSMDPSLNEDIKKEDFSQKFRGISTPKQAMLRSMSEFKMLRRTSLSDIKGYIDQQYEEQMTKFSLFKQNLRKRRESTMKQIQKNQQILKNLMTKFEKSKKKASKLKIRSKSKCSQQKGGQSISKKSNLSSKRQTPSKYSNNHSNTKPTDLYNGKKIGKIEREDLLFIDDEDKRDIILEYCPTNAQIYCHYVKEKKKMESNKSTPKKQMKTPKPDKTRKAQSFTSKKKENKISSSKAQKNILVISKFPLPKEERLDLKVNVQTNQPKKSGRGCQKELLRLVNPHPSRPNKQRISFK